MKLFFFLFLVSFNLAAQVELLKTADQKSYTPRIKGISDLVVDVESDKIKNQLNELKTLGHIKKLVFKIYWTAQPERFAVEVIGLPEGFKEIKDDLRINVAKVFEDIIPVPLEKKFASFELTRKVPKNVIAKDKNTLAPISSYELVFDANDRLEQVIANRPVGEMNTKYVYERTAFSDGKWVNKSQETIIKEAGQQVTIRKEVSYQAIGGMGFPTNIQVSTKMTSDAGSNESSEDFKFSNYQINKGDALKFFLNEGK